MVTTRSSYQRASSVIETERENVHPKTRKKRTKNLVKTKKEAQALKEEPIGCTRNVLRENNSLCNLGELRSQRNLEEDSKIDKHRDTDSSCEDGVVVDTPPVWIANDDWFDETKSIRVKRTFGKKYPRKGLL